VLIIDSITIAALFPLRARARGSFKVPLYPVVPAVFILVYVARARGAAKAQLVGSRFAACGVC
jgi:hypothetical protein